MRLDLAVTQKFGLSRRAARDAVRSGRIEIAGEVADSARSLVTEQVANGVAVRMAVLWSLLGSGGPIV